MNSHLLGVLFVLLALPGLSTAMEALDDRELGEVSGAGVGFFLDDFFYDQGSASAQVSGLKDSQGNALTIDLERAYIKGDGSQRGALDTPAQVGTPLHPFTLKVVSGAAAPTLPSGTQALQLTTPTWDDPLNDTHQYGLWSFYQGCLYGEAGCTDPTLAQGAIDTELGGLETTRDALLARYQSVGFLTLKSGIDQDMLVVEQRRAQVATETADVQGAYGTMETRYAAAPAWDGLYRKPAFGEKYGCGNVCLTSAARAYNTSVDSYQTQLDELAAAQKALGEAWSAERDGYSLNQRATDYDEFSSLCGVPTAESPTCVVGRIQKTKDNRTSVVLVATTLQNGGTRFKGLDVGVEATFSLPSTAYSVDGNGNIIKGATTTRSDFFSINLEGFTLNGAYLHLWGDSAGLQGEASLQMYADKLVIGGCRNCTDANRAVAKNLYFDINLGQASLQPLSFSVLSDGELRLSLPSVTWSNHQAFYQQVPKSNISIGNLNLGGVDLGSQVVRGMRVDYLEMRTVNLPR
ncbi:MAG TPA: hypothetical protein VFE95_00885 [Pseudomonas sp.]|jgi:hypothetical protein|nr:hypothetical protein [Pseudomonas sp.]